MFRAGPRTPRTPLVSPRCDVQRPRVHNDRHTPPRRQKVSCAWPANAVHGSAETRDRTGDLQIFGLTLSQLSYRGFCKNENDKRFHEETRSTPKISTLGCTNKETKSSELRHLVMCVYTSDISRASASSHQLVHSCVCRDAGSNRGPSDLRSDALPAELSRPCLTSARSVSYG